MFFFVPALGDIGTGISIMSHGNVIKIGCISDSSCIEDPREFIELIEKNYDSMLGKK